jgi:oligogalacturonide transport system ATP-binding protein
MQTGRIMQVATPKELYSRPANLFVAGFIGSPEMNLVDVKLDGPDFLIGSQRMAIGPHLEKRLETRPQDAVAGIRPQHFALVDGGPSFTARLTNAEFMGHEVYLHAELEGRKLVSVVGAADFENLGRSETIRLRPDPEQLHIFDKSDGRNVSL